MAKESTFDIVSEVDTQEVANAVNQASKEIQQRYDFKDTGASVEHSENTINLSANAEERVKAALDVLQSKLVRRGISLKALDAGEPVASGKLFKIAATIKEGIDQPTAKKISKIIRDDAPKSVKANIQGDQLRVSSKSRDDLQSVIALLRDFEDAPLQFINFK
ncbi:YajQ family cyclic di-GMP-binding protein [Yaniella flava]|uniref:Nucleotide-binding protein GCM10009720_19240 n=1 Tax=Yaniella flava TaxID=287930 RepID=A0ABP5G294_9MICC|nr:YajQ family cyclic di-GMP-binding protein [Micrococcaceae bacterium]